ncbi:Golgi to ER traffic protein 4 homolog [Exaiptasia diaphana]|uniref:Golgi to ER traffic protein 4 homolog n=1 Tax=Exaiptasia diaphana TaxID=2652724 RepID=A0A913X5Y2_EXADI|nr:Golgi to ER traffic protein 4 homolog [Exaiptasia diaphana]KXJ14956.1 Golgi to ER traffic protein 4-like [Exaiptasia diaphana]
MAAGRGSGAQRVLQKLNKSIEEGNYYESHQMIRTLYFRYMSQKKYKDAIELVYNGACLFLKHNQAGSGNDLAMLMIDCFTESNQGIDDDKLQKIKSIFELYNAVDVSDRQEFAMKALGWTKKVDPTQKYGNTELHHVFAKTYWQEKHYSESRYHFLYAHDGLQCAKMLIEFATTRGYPGEQDLFITQTVLQFLCLPNATTASIVFFEYTNLHPDFTGKKPPFPKPLLNFVWLLLLAIQRQKPIDLFTVLCEKYQPTLDRDPCYKTYLDRIAQLFFGLPPPKPTGMQGLMGDLMQSLFGDEDDMLLQGISMPGITMPEGEDLD